MFLKYKKQTQTIPLGLKVHFSKN